MSVGPRVRFRLRWAVAGSAALFERPESRRGYGEGTLDHENRDRSRSGCKFESGISSDHSTRHCIGRKWVVRHVLEAFKLVFPGRARPSLFSRNFLSAAISAACIQQETLRVHIFSVALATSTPSFGGTVRIIVHSVN